MPEEIIFLKLSREDVEQTIDGLSIRRDSWRNTQKYLEDETVEGVIEECCDSDEACWIADNYDRIINSINEQIAT